MSPRWPHLLSPQILSFSLQILWYIILFFLYTLWNNLFYYNFNSHNIILPIDNQIVTAIQYKIKWRIKVKICFNIIYEKKHCESIIRRSSLTTRESICYYLSVCYFAHIPQKSTIQIIRRCYFSSISFIRKCREPQQHWGTSAGDRLPQVGAAKNRGSLKCSVFDVL